MRKYYHSNKGYREVADMDNAGWISVESPDSADSRFLTETLGVPGMFLEYLGDVDEQPRCEHDGEWLMSIVRIPVRQHGADDPFITVPLGVISRGDMIVTVCYHQTQFADTLMEYARRKAITVTCPADFTLLVIYTAAFCFLKFLKMVGNDILTAGKHVRNSIRNDHLLLLMQLQKSLVYFNTSIKGDVILLERVRKIFQDTGDSELADDVEVELRQADSTVAIYTDILEATTDSFASIISNNVNAVMKRMTGVSIVLMVPTLVASLYGMNVDILIGGIHYAFWLIIGLSTVLTAAAFMLFRRIRWV